MTDRLALRSAHARVGVTDHLALGPPEARLGVVDHPLPTWPGRTPALLFVLTLVVAVVCAGSGTVLSRAGMWQGWLDRLGVTPHGPGVHPDAQTAAIIQVLDRRAAAVRNKDRVAFLSDIDRGKPELVAAQDRQFRNLTRLPLASFSYRLESARYDLRRHSGILAAYRRAVVVPAVTIMYRFDGVSAVESATPYLPVFGRVADRWLLVAEAVDSDVEAKMPWGFGAQPWQGDPIEVRVSADAVLVYSPRDENRAAGWLAMVDNAIRDVRRVRPGKWSGKVLVIAVADKKLIAEHMGADVDKVAAIAVEQDDRIPAWSGSAGPANLAASVVLINPALLAQSNKDFEFVLRHEITHVAMDPVEGDHRVPLWLVEGLADWVASGADPDLEVIPDSARKSLGGKDLSTLPADEIFRDDNGGNYLAGWVACDLIAERYGRDKLFALYEAFGNAKDSAPQTQDRVFREVLGIPLPEFTAAWRDVIRRAIADS